MKTLKKALSYLFLFTATALITFVISPYSSYAQSYENITQEVNLLQNYLDNGLYLEMQALCNELKNRNLSEYDKTLVSDYEIAATVSYNFYIQGAYRAAKTIAQADFYTNRTDSFLTGIDIMSKALSRKDLTATDISKLKLYLKLYIIWATEVEEFNSGYIEERGLTFICDKNTSPVKYGEYPNECIGIGNGIFLYSTPIDNQFPSKQYFLTYTVQWLRKNIYSFAPYGGEINVLSENDTTVGSFPARQVTLRLTKYKNYYKSVGGYQIMRFIAFERNGWLHIIEGEEDSYSWSDSFWHNMELVRNYLYFEN